MRGAQSIQISFDYLLCDLDRRRFITGVAGTALILMLFRAATQLFRWVEPCHANNWLSFRYPMLHACVGEHLLQTLLVELSEDCLEAGSLGSNNRLMICLRRQRVDVRVGTPLR